MYYFQNTTIVRINSIKSFFIAGSNNQAIEDVLAATRIENKSEISKYLIKFFV